MGATNLKHRIDHLLAHRTGEVLACPGGEEENAGLGVALLQSLAQDAQALLEHIHADAVHTSGRGIVVAGYDHHVVQIFAHLSVALVHARAPSFKVEGYAVAVPAIVIVLHAVLLGKLVVPGVLHRLTVVAHIAVADDAKFSPLQPPPTGGGFHRGGLPQLRPLTAGGFHRSCSPPFWRGGGAYYLQQCLAPELCQLPGTLLVGVQPVALAASVLLLVDVGLPVPPEIVVCLAVADVYLSGLAAAHHLGKHLLVLANQLQALLRGHRAVLGHIVGRVPDGLVQDDVRVGPQPEQAVDDGAEIVGIVLR